MMINISHKEANILVDMIEHNWGELKSEIRHTKTYTMKDKLKHRKKELKSIWNKLEKIQGIRKVAA